MTDKRPALKLAAILAGAAVETAARAHWPAAEAAFGAMRSNISRQTKQ